MTNLSTGLIRINFTRRVAGVLREVETICSMRRPAVVAIRLPMLTGSEFSEILTLHRDNVGRTASESGRRDAKATRIRTAESDHRKPR